MSINFSGTGTGLDQLVNIIMNDDGLAARTSEIDIAVGARAAHAMNTIIVEGIATLGLAGDGAFTAGDMRDLSDWISSNYKDAFTSFHGDDENGEETGFHLVQNDGAVSSLFGRNAVNSVADGIYHLVFGYDQNNIINEDGNRNAQLRDLAWWMNELLEDDLAKAANGEGPLAPQADPKAVTTSGSGLDQLVDMILDNPGLNDHVSTSEIQEGAQAAADINTMIRDIIVEKGLANDGKITASDVYDINAAIQSDPELYAKFVALHGDDDKETNEETGFHLVQNDGAHTHLFAHNGVNTIADSIYHIGFDIERGRFLNEDGNSNASVTSVANWINILLEEDFENGTLVNPDVNPLPAGTTGTGLDQLIDIIQQDLRLEGRIPTSEIAQATQAANTINQLILDGIKATGAANDGKIDAADLHNVSAWIQGDEARYQTFINAHGDDENNEETGFHLVQNDGASSRLFGENAVDTIADGIYHIGFNILNGRFLNEDGNRNQPVEKVAAWLNELLSDEDMASLVNPDAETTVTDASGTGLDQIVDMIQDDPGLNNRISAAEIQEGAQAAADLNTMIRDIIVEKGLANDGKITASDVYDINAAIQSDPELYAKFVALHGDDEEGEETGFHLVQNDGAQTRLFAHNGVNTIADSIYHIGFDIEHGRFVNEDGNPNASVTSVASWINTLLEEDFENGTLVNPDANPMPAGTTGTGLDQLIDIIQQDVRLEGRIPTSEIAEASKSANIINQLILDGIKATGAANDGKIDAADLRDINAWIQADEARYQAFIEAHGDDEDTEETGFHLVQNDGARSRLFGEEAVNTVADGIYHIGFDIMNGRFLNEDGNYNQSVEKVAAWLDELLSDEDKASLVNTDIESYVDGSTGTGLDQLIDIINDDPRLQTHIATSEIAQGAKAADSLNAMILEGILATGIAQDGVITTQDVLELNTWIRSDEARLQQFTDFHGNDNADGTETGFHLLEHDGSTTDLFGRNAVDIVMDGIYHIGFEVENNRFQDQNGKSNVTADSVAKWLNDLLADDLATGNLGNEVTGPSDASEVDVAALQEHVVYEGPDVSVDANGNGYEIVDHQEPLALQEGTLTFNFTANDTTIYRDVLFSKDASGYGDGGHTTIWLSRGHLYARFQTDHGEVYLHGNHSIQEGQEYNLAFTFDGQNTALYIDGERQDVETSTATWENNDEEMAIGANVWLRDDRWRQDWVDDEHNGTVTDLKILDQALNEAEVQAFTGNIPDAPVEMPTGSTGTGLDKIVQIITEDVGLAKRVDPSEIAEGARAADGMNAIIVEALQTTGLANDGTITAADIRTLSDWIADNHKEEFMTLHGDDESDEETGFHLVQNDGAETRLFGDNAVNTVSDGIYHLVFGYCKHNIINEDGNSNQTLEDLAWWLESLLEDDLAAATQGEGALFNADVNAYAVEQTNTGFDQITETIMNDAQLIKNVSTTDQVEGAKAGVGISKMILQAIDELSLGNDGEITVSDVLAINEWIRGDETRYAKFVELHGDDETNEETGFHLVQNDGAETSYLAENAVNTVFDGIFHIGFEVKNGRFLNEDGNGNASVSKVAYWINQLLEEDLEEGSLDNGEGEITGTTGTGLDSLVDIIMNDEGLENRISETEIREGARAADGMNAIIVEALQTTGLANDGTITAADIRTLSDWIADNRKEAFMTLHGDDEDNEETGFHLVQNDGAETRLFGDNAVNTVSDGIYHLVFGYCKHNIINEDGNSNQTLEDLAWWLESLLEDDLAAATQGEGALFNADVNAYAVEQTNTGFDQITETIMNDGQLIKNVSTTDQVEGAKAGVGISKMILQAIDELSLGNDGEITVSDVLAINEWIRSDEARYAKFVELHGDDETNEETGFHLVQNDGAETSYLAENAVNTVFDGIFHIGFEVKNGRFLNEDGNGNASVSKVAYWINQLLEDDLEEGSLNNGEDEITGTTGTGLDSLVDIIMNDEGLENRISETEIREGAQAANSLNEMIKEGIIATGIAQNGEFSTADIYDLNAWFRADETRYSKFVQLHGDDEENVETGFHLVERDGAKTQLYGDNAVDTVADGLYHIGFEVYRGRLTNEDGNANVCLSSVAGWLNSMLSTADFATLAAASTINPYVYGTTGTGLDQLVDIITNDDNLANRISTSEIQAGAEAAQQLNEIILDKIIETGVANDGNISIEEIYKINQAIQQDEETYNRFVELHGNDETGVETGFHLVVSDGAVTELFDTNAVSHVADGIYHLGFDIKGSRLLDEDGNYSVRLSEVSDWLNDLLEEDLQSGELVNEAFTPENIDLAALKEKEVFSLDQTLDVTKQEGNLMFEDNDALHLSEGSVVINFNANDPSGWGRDTLFSHDAKDYGNGGDLTIYLQNNELVARFQTMQQTYYLKSKNAVEADTDYSAAFTFNGETASLYLDGELQDVEAVGANWENNDEDIAIGASLMYTEEGSDRVYDRFDGEIDELLIFNEELNFAELQATQLENYDLV